MSSSMLSQVIRTRESFSTLLAGKGLFTSMKRTEVTLQVFLATESAATVLAHKCFRRVINSSRLATSSINHDLFIKRKVSRARLIKMVVMMMMMMVVGRYSWRKKSMFQFDLFVEILVILNVQIINGTLGHANRGDWRRRRCWNGVCSRDKVILDHDWSHDDVLGLLMKRLLRLVVINTGGRDGRHRSWDHRWLRLSKDGWSLVVLN